MRNYKHPSTVDKLKEFALKTLLLSWAREHTAYTIEGLLWQSNIYLFLNQEVVLCCCSHLLQLEMWQPPESRIAVLFLICLAALTRTGQRLRANNQRMQSPRYTFSWSIYSVYPSKRNTSSQFPEKVCSHLIGYYAKYAEHCHFGSLSNIKSQSNTSSGHV